MLPGGHLRPLPLHHELCEPLGRTLRQTARKLAARRNVERSSVEAAYQLAAQSPETESSQKEVVEDRPSEAQAAVEVNSAFAAYHVAEEAEVVEDRASEADAAADHADARTQAAAV